MGIPHPLKKWKISAGVEKSGIYEILLKKQSVTMVINSRTAWYQKRIKLDTFSAFFSPNIFLPFSTQCRFQRINNWLIKTKWHSQSLNQSFFFFFFFFFFNIFKIKLIAWMLKSSQPDQQWNNQEHSSYIVSQISWILAKKYKIFYGHFFVGCVENFLVKLL